MVWWLIFGTISVYWAAGGMWLVDTAVQERGVELAGGARRGSSSWYSPPGSSSTPSRCSPGWAGCLSSSWPRGCGRIRVQPRTGTAPKPPR